MNLKYVGRKLFLKWAVINVASLTLLWVICRMSWSQLSLLPPIGVLFLSLIGLFFLVANVYAATLAWRSEYEDIRTKADHIGFAAHECPFIGLLGAVAGIILSLSATTGAASSPADFAVASSRAMSGLGVAFIPTFFGVYCRGVLWWTYHLLTMESTHAKRQT
jgi:biopolymer transport protein ExbB/TolQ